MDFSLIFFSGDERKKYRLVLDAARFADEHRFTAIWTPERHFHRFGGLYPNPSVLSAGLAVATRRIHLRAGSVILPLHHPIRVAEEWAVVDNLSGGRVGIALATGFSPIDFAFRPEHWEGRRDLTFEAVETLRALWSGQSLPVRDGVGHNREIELHPRPVQPELPLWLTCTKSADTFAKAGALGCHVLTGLIDMTTEELEQKLQVYFRALEENGHDPAEFQVTLMLHTFLGDDPDQVRETVRPPFLRYLRQFLTVVDTQQQSLRPGQGVRDFDPGDQEALLEFGFDKFFHKGSLMGTPESCGWVVERMAGIGVTEIACLIDFGVDDDLVLRGLEHLDRLRQSHAG
jgi:natural product biosynthesis luciferase-like monooxygenase protein